MGRFANENPTKAFSFAADFSPLPATDVDGLLAERLDALFELEALIPFKPHQPLFASIFQASPHLLSCAESHPAAFARLFKEHPEALATDLILGVEKSWAEQSDIIELGIYLRAVKQQMALLLGISELGGIISTQKAVSSLSHFADACVHTALNAVLQQKIDLPADPARPPAQHSGLFILAMGKHGGFELNYSSDIDLIIYYDAQKCEDYFDVPDLHRHLARLVRDFTQLLHDHNEHGYVFRVDLRLRPDPSAMPSAISTDAALIYYQTRGRTWERTAYTKARCVAGDKRVGAAFLKELSPFVWRKYLDFAALEQIHDLKKQLHLARGLGDIVVAGHDIKRGRGGIREIEFFTQSQLLIAGGRDIDLRLSTTQEGLAQLAEKGWVDRGLADALMEHYWFLRAVENRLQMVDDAQTHQLPTEPGRLQSIAIMMGFDGLEAFEKVLETCLHTVSKAYDDIFETVPEDQLAEQASGQIDYLDFTLSGPGDTTLAHLSDLGFDDPKRAHQLIFRLMDDDLPAFRADQARHTLDQLLPNLLAAMGDTGQADQALINFDHFARSLPMGVQLFALLAANHGLLRLIVDILGTAPRLAELVGRRPHILDSLLDPQFLTSLPDKNTLKAHLDDFINQNQSFEDGLDRVRVIGQEFQFLISVRLLARTINAQQAASAFSQLAELIAQNILELVRKDMERQFGHVAQARLGILAMGRLGSAEMSATSDIDIILLYEHPDNTPPSDGTRSLDATSYFARLTQRLIAGLTAPTAEGTLYEADMRLRPSGRAGPLATRFKSFQTYQRNEAWTWEHQALTRARIVAGDDDLARLAHDEIDHLLTQPREASAVKKDVLDMRARLLRDRAASSHWDIKLSRGGLVDIEFLAQTFQLLHAHAHKDILKRHTGDVLNALGKLQLLPEATTKILVEAYEFYTMLLQILAISHQGKLDASQFSSGLKKRLASHAQMPDFDFLDNELRRVQSEVAALFDVHVGVPT